MIRRIRPFLEIAAVSLVAIAVVVVVFVIVVVIVATLAFFQDCRLVGDMKTEERRKDERAEVGVCGQRGEKRRVDVGVRDTWVDIADLTISTKDFCFHVNVRQRMGESTRK